MLAKEKEWKTTKLDYISIHSIPESIVGVYVIWCPKTDVCIYVGKAEESPVKKRLTDHWRGSHNKDLKSWLKALGNDNVEVCYRKTEKHMIDCLEKRLIHLWKPETNKDHNPNRNRRR